MSVTITSSLEEDPAGDIKLCRIEAATTVLLSCSVIHQNVKIACSVSVRIGNIYSD